MSDDPFFRFTNEKIDNAIGYNSGTFGFNKSNSDVFSEFIDYAILNKNKALNDQSLYNEFFNIKKIISPTLSEFVYLDHPVGNYCYTNKNDAAIIHFLGNYGNAGYKLNKIKQELEKNI